MELTFKLTNNITKRSYEYHVTDYEDSRAYYHFSVALDDGLYDGQYSYVLIDEEGVQVSDGILQVGDYTDDNNNEYNSDTNEYYRQYRG